jgi:hypothetical protein
VQAREEFYILWIRFNNTVVNAGLASRLAVTFRIRSSQCIFTFSIVRSPEDVLNKSGDMPGYLGSDVMAIASIDHGILAFIAAQITTRANAAHGA